MVLAGQALDETRRELRCQGADLKGEGWDKLLLPVVGEREAIVADWEPGKATLLNHQILTGRALRRSSRPFND
jgi:hypothetical protein